MIKIILLFLVSFLIFAGNADAAIGINLKKIPKLPPATEIPQAEFDKMTKVEREESPYNDPAVSYELKLPSNWTDNVQEGNKDLNISAKKLSENVLGLLGRYIGPPKNLLRSHLEIESQILTYEVSVQNWFVTFVLKNGYSLSALNTISDRALEALYVVVEGDQTYIVRARAIINGSRIVMIRYYLPQDNYDEDKDLQAQVLASFKLLKPSDERIEKQLEYGFLDQSYFNYPESWRISAKPIYSIERMSAMLYQERNITDPNANITSKKLDPVLNGQIKISVISRLLKTTLAEEIKAYRGEINIKGYKIGKLIENIPYTYDPSIRSAKAQIYELLPEDKVMMGAYEMLVTVMQGADFYYITSMITPSREQDFFTWARNMESAKIVNQSIRRSNVKIDPNDPYYDYLDTAK